MTIIVLKSLLISIFVINPYQTAAEGEYFAKGDENRVMDLCQWWAEEARCKHYAPEGAQCHSKDKLKVFHRIWKLDRFTVRPFALLTEGPLVTLAE